MRGLHWRRHQRGFTLIELLIVVAILGVLAAVVIPNVGRFLGKGESEANKTELQNVQSAVIAMMTDNNLSALPAGGLATTTAINTMAEFPNTVAGCVPVTCKVTDSERAAYAAADKGGYLLFSHDRVADGATTNLVNYVAVTTTKCKYTATTDGTVTQKTGCV